MVLANLLFLGLAYLGAAIPFGLVITTLYGGQADIRAAGSGNVGATNVARVYGWRLAAPVVAADIAKGFVPVLLARLLWPELGLWWPALVAAVCFVAHVFPVYLEFRGGKGVATGAGGLLALSPWVMVPAVGVWVTLLAATGRSSVAALGASLAAVGLALWLDPAVLLVVVLLFAGVALTHLTNIRRLVRGEESQVVRPVRWGRRSEAPTAEQLLDQSPAGQPLGPGLWREPVSDPLDPAEQDEEQGR